MLNLLRVSGFALIDEVEVPLGPGLTVITGETGAGKSILVEALGLLRGSRASAEMIRAGCEEARVEAVLSCRPDGRCASACWPRAGSWRMGWWSGARSHGLAGAASTWVAVWPAHRSGRERRQAGRHHLTTRPASAHRC